MSLEGSPIYEIRVEGQLDERWSDWFGGLTITREGEGASRHITILTGPVADEASLRGILTRIWDLNLTLISLARQDERRPGL